MCTKPKLNAINYLNFKFTFDSNMNKILIMEIFRMEVEEIKLQKGAS